MSLDSLNIQARCFLRTKIHLNQRQFSDFTIDELNDYASCVYDLMKNFHIGYEKFSLNRIEKNFEFIPTISGSFTSTYYRLTYGDIDKWEWFYSFLQYLFNVKGSAKFEYLVGVHYLGLTDHDKEKLNKFGKDFCDCLFYDLWGLFNKHKIVKQKILDYLCEIKMFKKSDGGIERYPGCNYGIGR